MSESKLTDNPAIKAFFEGGQGSMVSKEMHAELNGLPPPAPQPPAPPAPKAEAEAKAEEAEEAPVKPLTPMEQYEEDLKEIGLSLEQAAVIVDALITKMYYEEDVQVTKSLRIKFKTRTPEEIEKVNEALNTADVRTQGALFSVVAKHNLASSLIKYNDYVLNPGTPEGFKSSMNFINRLPGPVYQLLVDKLHKFDSKLNTVMQEGAIENF